METRSERVRKRFEKGVSFLEELFENALRINLKKSYVILKLGVGDGVNHYMKHVGNPLEEDTLICVSEDNDLLVFWKHHQKISENLKSFKNNKLIKRSFEFTDECLINKREILSMMPPKSLEYIF